MVVQNGTYASGETPELGDLVECIRSSGDDGLKVGTRYTVAERDLNSRTVDGGTMLEPLQLTVEVETRRGKPVVHD